MAHPRAADAGRQSSKETFFSFIHREPTHHAPAGLALPAAPSAGANGDPFDMSKADEPKPCCGGFVDRSLRLLPRQLWFIMSFIVLLGIFMAFAVPSFLYYRSRGDSALSGQWHGWIGCSAPTGSSTPNTNSTQAVILSRFKGVRSDLLNSDLGEGTWTAANKADFGWRFTQTCPWVNASSGGTPLVDNEPFVKVEFTLATITPDQASASMDVNITAVNCLSCTPKGTVPSLLNLTGGLVTIRVAPALSQNLTLDWNQGTKTYGAVQVQLITESPITEYPWDRYAIQRTISAEITMFNGTTTPETRPIPLQVWTRTTTQQFSVWVVDDQQNTARSTGSILYLNPKRPITIQITRSAFTMSYAVVLVVFLWLIGGLNLMHCLDNVFVRPRDLKDALAPALLFALPAFRNTMPGVPNVVGVAVDMIGLIWAELMISVCVLISFIAFLGQYHHPAPLFRREVKKED